MIELTSLTGKHVLSGVDRQAIHTKYGDAEQLNFVLDGVTYSAIEDPSDGYRSCMDELIPSDVPVINNFPSIEVMGKMKERGRWGDNNDTLEFYDIENGLFVLAIGTDNYDDYYPMFVADFHPENIHYNQTETPAGE